MATCGNAKALECSLKVTYTYFVSAASHSICRAEIESERDPFSRFQGREDGAVFRRRRRRRRGFFAVTPLLRSRAAELSIKEKEGGRKEGRQQAAMQPAGRRHDNLLCLYRQEEYARDSNELEAARVLQEASKHHWRLIFSFAYF